MTVTASSRVVLIRFAALALGAPLSIAAAQIQIPAPVTGRPHPITLDAIVGRRDLQEMRISPDGRRIAFVVKQGFREKNAYRAALYVIPTAGASAPVKLLEEESLSGVRWTPDSRSISFLSSRGGAAQVWTIGATGGRPTQVFRHAPGRAEHRVDSWQPLDRPPPLAGVFKYEWSRSGRQIAFTSSPSVPADRRKDVESRGVLYDDETMLVTDVVNATWLKPPTQLWIVDVRTGRERMVWQIDRDINDFSWAADEQRLAVTYEAPPIQHESQVYFNSDVGILSLADSRLTPIATGEAAEDQATWMPGDRAVAFVSSMADAAGASIGIVDLETRARTTLGTGKLSTYVPAIWALNDSALVYEAADSGPVRRGKSALYRIGRSDGSIRQLSAEAGHLSGCSVSADGSVAACIRQSTTVAPDPAIVDLRTGSVKTLANLNPELASATLGEATELRWRNKYGTETNGFLIKPVGYDSGRRYPTLVVLYGFGGKLALEAEWISSYPVQAFARDGFAVLLVNYPRYDNWTGRDFERGSVAEGYSPLASIERGARMLVEQGIADSTRLGILGWSYGCFLGEFAVTHSSLFRAAAVGDGGDYNPGIYWLGGRRSFRENAERVLGGPPFGPTLANWLKFSPFFNVSEARAPVLMEFNPLEALIGLEMSSAFRRAGVPVEFVLYPGEGHIFTQPQHRLNSMQRNLDWFNFWLQGREDSDPAKRDQYARWRSMRDQLARLPSSGAGQASAAGAVK